MYLAASINVVIHATFNITSSFAIVLPVTTLERGGQNNYMGFLCCRELVGPNLEKVDKICTRREFFFDKGHFA